MRIDSNDLLCLIDDDDIQDYVKNNFTVDDVYDDDDIQDYVKNNFTVDDVYDDNVM